MLNPSAFKDPNLTKLVRRVDPGTCVFKQGDLGNTMFIIIEGMVRILTVVDQSERLIAITGPGEMLGERAILSTKPYRRHLTAQAKTSCVLIEIGAETLKTVLAKVPDFHITVLGLVLNRLDKANHLIRILQFNDPIDRFVEYSLYFSQYHAAKLQDGGQMGITANEICQGANLEPHLVQQCLEELASHGILTLRSHGYLIENREALLNYVPTLKYMMAA